jgi:hypothetical protein
VLNRVHFFTVFSSNDLRANTTPTLVAVLYYSRDAVSLRPVLKHGPRSLTYVRVQGWQTHVRNESRCQEGQPALTPGYQAEAEHIG